MIDKLGCIHHFRHLNKPRNFLHLIKSIFPAAKLKASLSPFNVDPSEPPLGRSLVVSQCKVIDITIYKPPNIIVHQYKKAQQKSVY